MEKTEIVMDHEKKDFRKLYEDLVKSDWFKKAYHDKSLGDCPFDIPELAESEDERMCKRCIDLLRKVSAYSGEEYLGVEIADCIIWLQALIKKLKESLHITEICKEDADSFTDENERVRKKLIEIIGYFRSRGIDHQLCEEFLSYLEKQKEHTDTKQERIIKAARRVLNNWLYGDVNADVSGDLTELEYAFKDYDGEEEQKEQKPEERFKEAREKYQVEWSEEDEKIITRLIDYFESFRIVGVTTKWEGLDIQEVITLLKSFRPQYHGDITMTEAYKMGLEAGKAASWKPSEKQMEALEECGECKRCIKELYEQLKKLM